MHNVGRHTGINIKREYDKVVNFYDINNKVYKVITDQAANMKKAFELTTECEINDELIKLTTQLLMFQRKEDLKMKQSVLKDQLEKEIEQFNLVELDQNSEAKGKKRTREEVLNEFYEDLDEFENEITETDELNDTSDTLNDADDLSKLIDEFLFDDDISKIINFKTR